MSAPTYIPEAFSGLSIDFWLNEIPWGTFTDARQECFMGERPHAVECASLQPWTGGMRELGADICDCGDRFYEYTYGSGRGVRTYSSISYHPTVTAMQGTLNNSHNSNYNVCFLNRYDSRENHLGWHADDSPGMDHKHPIAVVSFGQEREIWWRENGYKGEIPPSQRQLLGHGSLFVMPAGFQMTHQHRIPKGDRNMLPRVSLTYRHYVPTVG